MVRSDDPTLADAPRRAAAAVSVRRDEADPALEAVVRRVVGALRVDASLVTLVGAEDQRFEAAVGLPSDLAAARGTPASWAFCRVVCETGRALVVPDACVDDRFRDNPL